MTLQKMEDYKDEAKTEITKTDYFASVAKWYGKRLLTAISQVRSLSGAVWACNSIGRVAAS